METEIKDFNEKKTPKKHKKLKIFIIAVIVVLVLLAGVLVKNLIDNKSFETSFYALKTGKVSDNIRIIELSDLHNSQFGKDNAELVKKIKSLHPDLIFYCGDMINNGNDDYSVLFDLSDKLSKIAPIYACYGNHELQQYLSRDKALNKKIEEHNVKLLSNEALDIKVKNTKIQLIAVTEGVKQYDNPNYNSKKFIEGLEPTNNIRICLTHYSDLFLDKLADKDIDFAFTGHNHGGVIRIPYIGGLITKDQGLLPKMTEGVQTVKGDTRVVISRGLGSSEIFPRINNKPELIVVDLNWY